MASEGIVTVSGRVLAVKCRRDGRFAVMLGPAPDVTWVTTNSPPRLGELVVASASESTRTPLPMGSLTLLGEDARVTRAPASTVERMVGARAARAVQAVMRRKLLGYQVTGAAWMLERVSQGKGAILADDPGLGKTTQTVAAVCAADRFPVVIVCPSSLKLNWKSEFRHAAFDLRVEVVDGRRGALPQAEVYILNYGVLQAREAQLARLRPGLIVFDEAHELKEPRPTAKHRASVATRLAHSSGGVIALTGSPLMNHPREFWRLLHIADPQEWPEFDAFDRRYLRPQTDGPVGKRIVTSRGRAENVVELQVRTQDAMLRRRKSEVAGDLPPKETKSVLVSLDAFDQRAYDEAEEDVVAWLQKLGQGRRAMAAARTLGFAKLTMLRRIAAVGKMRRAVPSYLSAWFSAAQPSPLVVFAYHRSILAGVGECARRIGLRYVGIDGGDDVSKRQAAVDLFQKGKADLFICPIRAGGVGINLQRASDSLFLERDWSPSVLRQAEDRVHRLGQTKPVTICYLDARGTVDEHVAEVLGAKQRLIQRLIDGDSDDTATQAVGVSLLKRLAMKGSQQRPVSIDNASGVTK